MLTSTLIYRQIWVGRRWPDPEDPADLQKMAWRLADAQLAHPELLQCDLDTIQQVATFQWHDSAHRTTAVAPATPLRAIVHHHSFVELSRQAASSARRAHSPVLTTGRCPLLPGGVEDPRPGPPPVRLAAGPQRRR